MKGRNFFVILFLLILIYFLCFFKREYVVVFDYCSFDVSSLEGKFVYDYNTFNHGKDMKAIIRISTVHSILFHFNSDVKSFSIAKNDTTENISSDFVVQCD